MGEYVGDIGELIQTPYEKYKYLIGLPVVFQVSNLSALNATQMAEIPIEVWNAISPTTFANLPQSVISLMPALIQSSIIAKQTTYNKYAYLITMPAQQQISTLSIMPIMQIQEIPIETWQTIPTQTLMSLPSTIIPYLPQQIQTSIVSVKTATEEATRKEQEYKQKEQSFRKQEQQLRMKAQSEVNRLYAESQKAKQEAASAKAELEKRQKAKEERKRKPEKKESNLISKFPGGIGGIIATLLGIVVLSGLFKGKKAAAPA